MQTVFEEAAAFASREISLTNVDEPERLGAETASERYFSVLGVSPILGRTFTREEAAIAGADRVVVIGEGLWRRHFGGDRGIIGRTIHVNMDPYTVVGVLPRSFRGLSGRAAIWLPIAAFESRVLTNAYNHTYFVVGRRRPEVVETAGDRCRREHRAPDQQRLLRPQDRRSAGKRDDRVARRGAHRCRYPTRRRSCFLAPSVSCC